MASLIVVVLIPRGKGVDALSVMTAAITIAPKIASKTLVPTFAGAIAATALAVVSFWAH